LGVRDGIELAVGFGVRVGVFVRVGDAAGKGVAVLDVVCKGVLAAGDGLTAASPAAALAQAARNIEAINMRFMVRKRVKVRILKPGSCQ
jgi:hypothetical protein